MTTIASRPGSGVIGRRLFTEPFDALTGVLARWRRDPQIRLMDSNTSKGRILRFVKGLRFSAQVAYLARHILSEDQVEVSWGHLVNDDGMSCSPECDVIIHRPGECHQWNGKIMDFRFIYCSNALAVVSCKSDTRSVDKKYCSDFQKYGVNNIILFAECCKPHRVIPLKEQALKSGYSGFYYLYTLDGDIVKQDEDVYIQFAEALKKAVSKPAAPRRKTRS